FEIPEEDVADAGVTPVEHGGSLDWPVSFEPVESSIDQGVGLTLPSPVVVPTLGVEVLIKGGGAVVGAVEKAEVYSLRRQFVQAHQDAQRAGLQFGLLLRRGVGQPTAEDVWRHVGRDDAVDVVHDEKGR